MRQSRSVSSGSANNRSTSRGNERQGQPLRQWSLPPRPSHLRDNSPRQAPRQRSPSPDDPPRQPTRSRWDKRDRSPPRKERSLSPHSKRKFIAGQ